jgi:phage recombination protein Bet
MSNVVTVQPDRRSVTVDLANRYGMEAAAFEATVRATCIKPDRDGRVASREEFAAFLLVAKHYGLNPLTKEIYAFTDKGRVVPIVSVDGWANLINSHAGFDGMEFDDIADGKDSLSAITCRMFRKDRSHATSVTEYMAECRRDTDPWKKWPRRMLRHKAMIQAARYAFGFAGIYDEDEGERIISATPPKPPHKDPPAPPLARSALSPPKAPEAAPEPATQDQRSAVQPLDFDAFRKALDAAATLEELNSIYDDWIAKRPQDAPLTQDEQDEADAVVREIAAKFWTEE